MAAVALKRIKDHSVIERAIKRKVVQRGKVVCCN